MHRQLNKKRAFQRLRYNQYKREALIHFSKCALPIINEEIVGLKYYMLVAGIDERKLIVKPNKRRETWKNDQYLYSCIARGVEPDYNHTTATSVATLLWVFQTIY